MSAFSPQNFLVLVVDDVPTNLKVVGNILDRAGYDTTFATSGQQALERVKVSKPDLILLDLMMPGMNGLQVCEILQMEPDYANLPIVFLTASHEREHLIQAFEHGAVDYVTKPFNPVELLGRVKNHLKFKETHEQLQNALAEIERLKGLDGLTHIQNRQGWLDAATQAFQKAQLHGLEFALLLVALNSMQQINYAYGYPVGDEVLQSVALTLQHNLPPTVVLGRYSSTVFAAIVPDTSLEQTSAIAAQLRSAVATPIMTGAGRVEVALSMSVVTWQSNDTTIEQMLRRVDQSLAQASATNPKLPIV